MRNENKRLIPQPSFLIPEMRHLVMGQQAAGAQAVAVGGEVDVGDAAIAQVTGEIGIGQGGDAGDGAEVGADGAAMGDGDHLVARLVASDDGLYSSKHA